MIGPASGKGGEYDASRRWNWTQGHGAKDRSSS
jgi:hypothetical protein